VETSQEVMEPVESLSMATSSPMRTSRSPMPSESSPWPTLVPTLTEASSLLLLLRPHGSMADTSFSAEFLKTTSLLERLKSTDQEAVLLQRRSFSALAKFFKKFDKFLFSHEKGIFSRKRVSPEI
jgi:hypothetical protein